MVLGYMTIEEFEDYIQRPENVDRLLELINGEIVEKLPTEEHGIIVLNIAAPLQAFVRQQQLGRVSTEARHHLPGDARNVRLPDISFHSGTAPVVRQGAIPHMPDLAVEVQSPSQSDDDMAEKAAYYLANGSGMVWLVFPAQRRVELHAGGHVEHFSDGDTVHAGDVLPGFELSVSDIFRLD